MTLVIGLSSISLLSIKALAIQQNMRGQKKTDEYFSHFSDGHTIEKMRVVWKKGFDQSKVTDNNYISLTQFEYAVFFEENYEEEIASGK